MYATVFRLLWPYLQRASAKYAADYLQQRREQRLQQQSGQESTATLLAEQAMIALSPLVQPKRMVEPVECPPVQTHFLLVNAVWYTLSGVLLGSAIGLMLSQIFRRED
jgi:hypothetical protein